jgi:hypothetical protein
MEHKRMEEDSEYIDWTILDSLLSSCGLEHVRKICELRGHFISLDLKAYSEK